MFQVSAVKPIGDTLHLSILNIKQDTVDTGFEVEDLKAENSYDIPGLFEFKPACGLRTIGTGPEGRITIEQYNFNSGSNRVNGINNRNVWIDGIKNHGSLGPRQAIRCSEKFKKLFSLGNSTQVSQLSAHNPK